MFQSALLKIYAIFHDTATRHFCHTQRNKEIPSLNPHKGAIIIPTDSMATSSGTKDAMGDTIQQLSAQIVKLRLRLQTQEDRATAAEEQLGIWKKIGKTGPQDVASVFQEDMGAPVTVRF